MLRYEVYNQGMVRSIVISNDYSVKDFPYLKQAEIVRTRKQKVDLDPEGKDHEKKTEIHEVGNSELLKYFCVSTEIDNPKVNLINCRPSVYPKAEKMARDITRAIDSHLKPKGYECEDYLLDFIESSDGVTYFNQIKYFTFQKYVNISNF